MESKFSKKYDFNELNAIIKEYLQEQSHLPAESVEKILQAFEQEEKKKAGSNILAKYSEFQINKVPSSASEVERFPALYSLFMQDEDYQNKEAQLAEGFGGSGVAPLSSREEKLSLHLTRLGQQHGSVLQSARQIFSIAINCLQQLHNIKDGNQITDPNSLAETIENYKVQLDKYDQILKTEGHCDRSKLFSEAVMIEHRSKLI